MFLTAQEYRLKWWKDKKLPKDRNASYCISSQNAGYMPYKELWTRNQISELFFILCPQKIFMTLKNCINTYKRMTNQVNFRAIFGD